ncbi:hypothetical protein [Shewanella violacea]|uniref:Uncharacterized protein n=1 Tax=Shewanella violacea (strain JCM 10179 / CIP 106290 / LMG 19151 / DSS12) TaxID=637905 RepID=D4ZMA2_SHEVD|nr:hypothetical protein [Shewanella violacea]BAJ02801.1 hypothetical protein SVI_2830 [Shewanella violacea DSS12]
MCVLSCDFLSLVNLNSVTNTIQPELFFCDYSCQPCVEVSERKHVANSSKEVEGIPEFVREQEQESALAISADFQFFHDTKYMLSLDFNSTILWSGRGMMPHQISEEIKAGGITLEDIAL